MLGKIATNGHVVRRPVAVQPDFVRMIAAAISLSVSVVGLSVEVRPPVLEGWVDRPEQFKPSLRPPAVSSPEAIVVPTDMLRTRIFRHTDDPRIEPLYFRVPLDRTQGDRLVDKVALPGRADDLRRLLNTEPAAINVDPSPMRTTFRVTPKLLELMDINQLGELFTREHQNVAIDTERLAAQPAVKREFRRQLAKYLGVKGLRALDDKIAKQRTLDLDRDLLPEFARRVVGRFTPFRGPNCFHSALAFSNPFFPRLRAVNVREEEGYHRAMINYDELWRALQLQFYEVDTKRYPIQYGDILVFFDVPLFFDGTIDFKWIRHSAVYLFDKYTFSKGSKSADSPYTVKTLTEEWTTWQRYSKNLRAKVFRRNAIRATREAAKALTEWMD